MNKPRFADRVTRGFAWTHLYKIAEYGLINLYNVLIIRHFGPELVGPYALYLSAGTVLSLVGAFAVDGVLLRFTSHAFDKDTDASEHGGAYHFLQRLLAFRILTVAAITLLSIAAGLLVTYFYPALLERSGSLVSLLPYLIIFLFAQAITAFCTFTMMGLLEARQVFFSSLVSRTLLIGLGFVALAGSTLDLEQAVQIHLAASVLQAALLFFWMKRVVFLHAHETAVAWTRGVGAHLLALLRSKRHLLGYLGTPIMAYGITTWGTDILSSVLSRQPDILMLTAILGERSSEVGFYQVGAMVLLLAEYALLFGLGGTLVAAFSSLSREDEQAERGQTYPRLASARRKVFGFQLAATTPLFIFLALYAEPFILLLFGAPFLPAVQMIQAGLIVLLLTVGVVGGGMHVTSLVSTGLQRTVFKIRLSWGILNLIGNYFLILWFGAFGALIGTQLANLGACATEGIVADRRIGPSRNVRSILGVFAVSLVAVGLPWGLLSLTSLSAPLLLTIGGITSVALYLALSIAFRLRDVLQVLERLSLTFLHRSFPFQRMPKEVLS